MTEPVVGWRLWRMEGGFLLRSWAIESWWIPGENRAVCRPFKSSRPCASTPGNGCQCGFWALYDPRDLTERASGTDGTILGLIAGYGTVALHGPEGFRCAQARILCLFEDRFWSRPVPTRNRFRDFFKPKLLRELEQRRTEEPQQRRLNAAAYGVPLVSITHAANSGLLAEFGVPEEQIRNALELVEKEWP